MHSKLSRTRTLGSALRGIGHWWTVKTGRAPLFHGTVPALDMRFTVPMDTIFSWHLAKYRAYEPNISNWMLERTRGDDPGLYVDVGANFGWYACLLARHGGRQPTVVAFEPAPANLALLRENLRQNGCEAAVHVVPMGAGRQSGQARLHWAPGTNPGMHSFVPMSHVGGANGGEMLSITTLDEALAPWAGRTVDLLKIDVEGFEHDVLLGAPAMLARTRAVILEYSPAFLRKAGHEPMDLPRLLLAQGFDLFELTREGALEPLTPQAIAAKAPGDNPDFFQFDLVGLRPA